MSLAISSASGPWDAYLPTLLATERRVSKELLAALVDASHQAYKDGLPPLRQPLSSYEALQRYLRLQLILPQIQKSPVYSYHPAERNRQKQVITDYLSQAKPLKELDDGLLLEIIDVLPLSRPGVDPLSLFPEENAGIRSLLYKHTEVIRAYNLAGYSAAYGEGWHPIGSGKELDRYRVNPPWGAPLPPPSNEKAKAALRRAIAALEQELASL